MTKLGLHANRSSQPLVPFVRDAKPRIVKFLDHDLGTIQAVHAASPGTLLIGRLFTNDQRFQNPKQDAANFVAKILPYADRLRGLYEAWESYNEMNPATVDEAKRLNEFHVEFANQMHAHGLKTIAYNFSTGTPELDMWQYYADGAAASDYLGLHEYDAPRMDTLHQKSIAEGKGGMWLALRYRRARAALPPNARKPIIITECGVDGGVANEYKQDEEGRRVKKQGYKDFRPEHPTSDYMAQLTWYDDELNKDGYLVGACLFCFGQENPRWETFDLANDDEARPALVKVMTRTMVAPPQPPPPPPPPLPPPTTQPCPIPVASWLSARYTSDAALRAAMGCPVGPDQPTGMAVQHFQYGVMFWRSDLRYIYALLNRHQWADYVDTWTDKEPEAGYVVPPPGLIEPKRGFGKVWRTTLSQPNAWIGFGVETERGITGRLQAFEHALGIRDEQNNVFIIKADETWV
jgi:hypothetical protein